MSYMDYVRRVVPYVPGEQPKEKNIIKLNTNENPYPPSPGVAAALAALPADELRLYPDPAAEELVDAIAKHCEVTSDEVFAGVGSDDVLAMIFLTFFGSDAPVLFPDITYSFYDVWAGLFRVPYRQIPLGEHFEIEAADYYGEHAPNGGVIFPNPNAPTGMELPLHVIEDIIRHNPDSLVVVDEAYVDFGAASALFLTRTYENLLVVQTLSKSRSLAGMRIGFAVGNKKLISCLKDVKYSFNSYTMNRTAIAAGAAAIRDEAYFEETRSKVIATRQRTKQALARLGFTFGDSKANFIFAAHASVPAKEIFAALKARRIYVRYFDKPRIDNYLRISIGTDEEMQTLIEALAGIVKQ